MVLTKTITNFKLITKLNGWEVVMEKQELGILEGGNIPVILSGIAAAALAIIGLAGIAPRILASVAAISIGASLILAGIAVAAERRKLLSETVGSGIESPTMFSFSLGFEVIGGITSVVLGILALLNIYPTILLGANVIVLGVTFLAMSITDARINNFKLELLGKSKVGKLSYEAVKATIDIQVLVGIGLGTLGILAIIGIVPMILILVSYLSAGIALLFKGTTLGVRLYEEYEEGQTTES